MRFSLILVVIAATLGAPELAHARGNRVAYVAAGAAYLDVGSEDGLSKGMQVDIVRRRRKVATCEVVEISAHHALCGTDRAAAGDRIQFAKQKAPSVSPSTSKTAVPRPPVPSGAELEAKRRSLDETRLEKVVYKKSGQLRAPSWSSRGSISVRQQVWATSTNELFVRPSVDASIHASLGLFRGLYASGAARVVGDVLAPAEQRFRPGEVLELYIWDAAVGISEGTVVGAVGRFRPRKAPGMQLLDGVQAGVALFGGTLELGAYGGATPDLITLAPAADRLTAGAYFGLDVEATDGVFILPRARVGVLSTPDFATARTEAEALTQLLWRGVGSLGGSVRAGVGGSAGGSPTLDAARVDLDLNPWTPLQLRGGWRYLAPLVVDFDAPSRPPPVGGAHHADLAASLAATPWLVPGIAGGVGYDVVTKVTRGYAGPELGLPRAFGDAGGLSLGWLEELGFWSGRSSWIAATWSPGAFLRVLARASYFENEALGEPVREGAFLAGADAPIFSWLTFRGRLQLQSVLPELNGGKRAAPSLLVADLGLSASW